MASPLMLQYGRMVLLYRPMGLNYVTVGYVRQSNELYTMYKITDRLDENEETFTIDMRPHLDFAVPAKGVRVIDNRKENGNATINEMLFIKGELHLNVTYDNRAYNTPESKRRKIFEVGVEGSYSAIHHFSYEGLPLMNVGTKITVYPNGWGNLDENEDLTGAMAQILGRHKSGKSEPWVYRARLIKNDATVWVERDEAMPGVDKDEWHAAQEAKRDALREAGVDPAAAATMKEQLQRLGDGLYYLDEDGKLRKVDDQADITAAAWKECCVCMKKKSLVACVPCGHRVMCQQCYEKWKKKNPICPVCKSPIEKVVKVLGSPYIVQI